MCTFSLICNVCLQLTSFGIDGSGSPATTLQHALVPIQPSFKCNDVINVIPQGDQICGGDINGFTICRGDSGSGLAFKSTEWDEDKYSIHVSYTFVGHNFTEWQKNATVLGNCQQHWRTQAKLFTIGNFYKGI